MGVEYYYELTGRRGETIFKALRERDFDDIVEGQAGYYIKQGIPGGERRDSFIDEKLWKSLDGDDLDAIRENRPELQGRENKEIKEWLMTHECPVSDEEELIRRWAWERANDDAQCGVLWDHFDHDNDAQTALNMGLVNYPPFVDGKYVDGGDNTIPAEAANEIRRLTDEANRIASEYHVICGTDQSKYTEEQRSKRALVDSLWKEASELERKAVERFILVSGFYCDIHGGRAEYAEAIQRSEVVACPSCGHPICPVCANCYDKDPKTEEEARQYLKSCDEVAGMAYCGQCGDWSEGFMLRFLRLVKCPVPLEYLHTKPAPRKAEFYATASVSALPDADAVCRVVAEKFNQGVSGIIKVEHPTGEIWGYPERHPHGWVVTVLYPHER